MKKTIFILVIFFIPLFLWSSKIKAAEDIQVLVDGSITFKTKSKKATTDIRYKTTGFTVHRDIRCEKNKVQCAPRDKTKGPFGDIENLKQEKEVTLPDKIHVETYFKVPKETVNTALHNAKLDRIQPGDIIYLSSVFNVLHGDKMLPKRHFDLLSIKRAEGWAQPNAFGQYYDIEAKYKAYHPAYAIVKLSDGTEISETKIKNNDKEAEEHFNWPVNSSVFHEFDKEITPYDNGQTYRIYKSYIQSRDKKNEQKEQQNGDPDTNPSLTKRNFTVGLGGVNVVAVYKPVGSTDDRPEGKGICTPPEPLRTIRDSVMDPQASAVIRADNRGSEQFDVLQGIPTSETLYGNAFALDYLFSHVFVQMGGTCTYEVPVEKTFMKKWSEPVEQPDGTTLDEPFEEEETVRETMKVERLYDYWVVKQLEVYQIQEAKLYNDALPNGQMTLEPEGYRPPNVDVIQQAGIRREPEPQSLVLPAQNVGKDLPEYLGEFQAAAEASIGKVEVRNDSLRFMGTSVMNGEVIDESGPSPGSIPHPVRIDENVLFADRQWIDSYKENERHLPSSGTIYYELLPDHINGGADKEFPIPGINPVTIHTPVVTYASVSDDRTHNQKTKPSPNRAALILERPFTVRLPTSGQHVSYPGYGNRDYAQYVRTKQVWFPFDVYSGDSSRFIPKRTWIDIPVNQLDTTFSLPVWVDEGNYSVLFRTIAENAPVQLDTQPNANTELKNHVSTDVVEVEVIGRLYDFRLTDIVDYNWEKVFRKQAGSHETTGATYWVGEKGIDGEPRGNQAPYSLPIRPGSHPLQGYRNVAVKTGYHFKFDLKTKGNMFGPKDSIRITPSFYYASKDGKIRFPVDLYYHSNDRYFIRVGSQEDQVGRYVILNERLRNVPTEQLIDTASYKYDREGQGTSLSRQAYIDQYIEKWTRRKTPVGGYGGMLLPEGVRTFIGPKSNLPDSVDAQRANTSIQQWYGEYSLPAGVYIVRKGTDIAEYGRTHGGLHDKSPIFLRDGYLIVNFNIESIRDGRTAAPHLQYIQAPLMNQWRLEGFERTIRDSFGHAFVLKDGDVLFYHANLSSQDDFGAMVPH